MVRGRLDFRMSARRKTLSAQPFGFDQPFSLRAPPPGRGCGRGTEAGPAAVVEARTSRERCARGTEVALGAWQEALRVAAVNRKRNERVADPGAARRELCTTRRHAVQIAGGWAREDWADDERRVRTGTRAPRTRLPSPRMAQGGEHELAGEPLLSHPD